MLAPGTGLATLVISNNLTLDTGSTTVMKVSHSPFTNDLVRVSGMLTFEGALVVTNAGAAALAAGDDFRLFTFSRSNGVFATLKLPAN